MPALYLTEQGALLRHEDHRLIVEKAGQELRSVPLAHVDEVIVFGNVAITTPTLKLLLRERIDTVMLHEDGGYCGRLVGGLPRNGLLRKAQYAAAGNDDFALGVARACIAGKLRNMRTILQRYNRDLQRDDIAEAAERIAADGEAAASAETHPSLMGYEGAASAEYFRQLPALFKRPWPFERRLRRPPPDPVNVLLSFAYTLLSKAMESAIQLVGLDPYIGFLHETVGVRASLAQDLIEEFRPIIADSVVLRCLNTELVKPEDFSEGEDPARPVVFSPEGIKRFVGEYEARMATEINHPLTGEQVTYRRCIELQVRALAAAVRTGGAYRAFTVR